MILRIILGLIGLGIVVFVHELGHFLAARLMGIEVEAFSIGRGRPLWKRKIGGVEYRIGPLPIGGYCQMRGEAEFRESLSHPGAEIPREKGTFYGASPLKRIFVAFAGPAANVLFAVLVLTVVWGIGFEVRTLGNRVVLASSIDSDTSYPADSAGLKTGDRIVKIDGVDITNYQEVQEAIAPNADKEITLEVERDGQYLDLSITPKLDPSSGAGKIGVYYWTDPIVEVVKSGGAAAIAGVKVGDRITKANGIELQYTVALLKILKDRPNELNLEIDRGGETVEADVVLSYLDNGVTDLGLEFQTIRFHTPRLSPLQALKKGALESWTTFELSVKSLALLFRGVDLTKAVSGPVRITYMVGDVAAEGFGQSFGAGMSAVASFLALLSIALCLMNLLPIPALDGGLILLFLTELVTRKPLRTKFVYFFQLIGTAIIFGLLLFSLYGDILFLFDR